mgnify:CR=1 FL=1
MVIKSKSTIPVKTSDAVFWTIGTDGSANVNIGKNSNGNTIYVSVDSHSSSISYPVYCYGFVLS